MSFSPSFTAEQLYATPTILRVTDTGNNIEDTIISEGDNTIISESGNTLITEIDPTIINDRKVYLRKDDGNYLVPSGVETDYIDFPLNSDYVDIDVLDKDYALEVAVDFNEIGTSIVSEQGILLLTENNNSIISN